MPVERFTPVRYADLTRLTDKANSKAALIDKPFKFLPPVKNFANERAMLRWAEAEWGASELSKGAGGIAVRTDLQKVFQLTASPHTTLANWADVTSGWRFSNFGGGAPGRFAYVSGTVYRWSVSQARWVIYSSILTGGGWRSELARMRAELFTHVYQLGVARPKEFTFTDGEWYREPHFSRYEVFSDQVFPWRTSNPWAISGIRAWHFRDLEYVFPLTDQPTHVEVGSSLATGFYSDPNDRSPEGFALSSVSRWKGRLPQDRPVEMSFEWGVTIDEKSGTGKPIGSDFSYTVINGFGATVSERRGLDFVSVLFNASRIPWSGTDTTIGVWITGGRDTHRIASIGGGGTAVFRLDEDVGATALHNKPCHKILVPNAFGGDRAPAIWVFANRVSGSGESHEDAWDYALNFNEGFVANPVGETNGVWLGKPLPLSSINFEENQVHNLGSNLAGAVLQRYAHASTKARGDVLENVEVLDPARPITADYAVPRTIDYNIPRVYCRRFTLDTTNEEVKDWPKLWMYGRHSEGYRKDLLHRAGMIYSVTMVRNHGATVNGIKLPALTGPELSVQLGFIQEDSPGVFFFTHLSSEILPGDQESRTIFPNWANLDGSSMAYVCSEELDVQASIISASGGNSKILDPLVNDVFNDRGGVTPIMAFHYNDTEKMLAKVS